MNSPVYNANEVIHMTTEQQVKTALAFAGMSQRELARRLGMTPQNLGQRLGRERFTPKDMEAIASAIGARWVAKFVFDDGTAI